MSVEMMSLAMTIPTSSSPIMGAPSPAFADTDDFEESFAVIQSIFADFASSEFSLAISCRNPFQLSKREVVKMDPKVVVVGKDEINIAFKPLSTAYFAYTMGKQSYSSKVYGSSKAADGKESSHVYDALFFKVVSEAAPTFKSVSGRTRIVCSHLTRDDVTAMLKTSKHSDSFEALEESEKKAVLDVYTPVLQASLFKVESLALRFLNVD